MNYESLETNLIREQNATIKRLKQERDDFSFSRREITRQWMDVLEDLRKEHEKEVKKLKKVIAELLDIVASLKNRNFELDENSSLLSSKCIDRKKITNNREKTGKN